MSTDTPFPERLSAQLPPPDALVVLIVDDVPDNVAPLHDALDEAGYTVLVALDGEAAIRRARQALPDVILLDAVMPGIDGFEVARRLKADPATAGIPIIFMTGLTETEHLVAALDAGGADYVTKPVKPREVMARMGVHLQSARQAREGARERQQARNALDALGYAAITVRALDGRLMWQTPLARDWLRRYCGTEAPVTPEPVVTWLRRHLRDTSPQREAPRLSMEQGPRRLTFRLHQQVDDGEPLLPGAAHLYAGGESRDPKAVSAALQEEADRLVRSEGAAAGVRVTAWRSPHRVSFTASPASSAAQASFSTVASTCCQASSHRGMSSASRGARSSFTQCTEAGRAVVAGGRPQPLSQKEFTVLHRQLT